MHDENKSDTSLKRRIFQKIEENPLAAISFAEFMDLALYEPELGYYSRAGRAIGRDGGDFYTSVSVGDCFGLLLSYAIEEQWQKGGSVENYLLIEQGAHDGQLAFDILDALQQRDSALLKVLSYWVIEPHEGRRAFLQQRIENSAHGATVKVVAEVKEIAPEQSAARRGIFLCNELVDAFAVERIRLEGGEWKRLWVKRADTESGFEYQARKIEDARLLREVAAIDLDGLREGYTTEINLAMRPWLQSVSALFEPGGGHWWIIDYGHREEDYFSPERTAGTLRCYHQHRATDDAFVDPGELDITAHVNFSRLAKFAATLGMKSEVLQDQHDFLIRSAKTWLLKMEAQQVTQEPENKKRLRQFQTLTHPGMMGRQFKVLRLRN
ncbi:MAG: SAM-dependent methyltransferase [Verrucomicrobiales bacterium]|nr:SAM-dependent methyltransferase [Verrucomicrobiales bacterium]